MAIILGCYVHVALIHNFYEILNNFRFIWPNGHGPASRHSASKSVVDRALITHPFCRREEGRRIIAQRVIFDCRPAPLWRSYRGRHHFSHRQTYIPHP